MSITKHVISKVENDIFGSRIMQHAILEVHIAQETNIQRVWRSFQAYTLPSR